MKGLIIINDNYFKNPMFPNKQNNEIEKNIYYQEPNTFDKYNYDGKDINEILKNNKGKVSSIYTLFNNIEKVFKGIIESSENDYIVLSDPSSGKWYIIKSLFITYIEFDESIKYN